VSVDWKCLLGFAGAALSFGAHAADLHPYFGDLHIHTRLSTDAYAFGTRATPDDAYRYAKGESIEHPAGYRIGLVAPLDFAAVTDHGEYLGMLSAMGDPAHPLSQVAEAARIAHPSTFAERDDVFRNAGAVLDKYADDALARSAWEIVVASAERHYAPGRFTTFSGYEFTSAPGGQNLHRNVIFRGSDVPDLIFTRIDSMNPEALWEWMDNLRTKGIESLAIPHNSNGSNGQMFKRERFEGGAMDARYAAQRMRNEPLVEVSQTKGTSETHPFLSPNDEWADFEIYPYRIARWDRSAPSGSYVREAYLTGLVLAATSGFNPYRFGLVGASDTHVAAGSFDETKHFSARGLYDATAERRGSVPIVSRDELQGYAENFFRHWSAAGLTGVWAEANTREALFDAFRRKETFATSGPRIAVRLFASFEFPPDLLSQRDRAQTASRRGVAMGGEIRPPRRASPQLFVWAVRDPASAALQRVQIVKGWVDGDAPRERVYDVACSDGGSPDPTSHRCPDNGATVDPTNCAISQDVGAAELATVWTDPDFDSRARAFYYARVLENPTCRWSTWDAVRAGVPVRPDLPVSIQERAWTSPIWIEP